MTVSLVIPCYNESANLPTLIRRCQELTAKKNIEVVLVDNGSTDSTPKVLSELLTNEKNIRSVRVDVNKGYGHGILTGLRAARGDVLGWTHADMQTDPMDLLVGVEIFHREGPHCFVKGRRFGRPVVDQLFTVGMSIYESLLLGHTLWDINAQPTMFSREFFESWESPPEDFALDLYAYYLAKEKKLKVRRFPVHFGKRLHGQSSWNINWAAKKKFIRRTISYSHNLRQQMWTKS